jgi:hypothetical protein
VVNKVDFRLPFSKVDGKNPEAIARQVLDLRGLPLTALSLRNLVLDEEALAAPIHEWKGSRVFGRGVYIFRRSDENGKHWPIYVGRAPHEFHARFHAHWSTEPKPGWGFNAMLGYIQRFSLDGKVSLRDARKWLLDGGSVVVIDMDPDGDVGTHLRFWENGLIRAMYAITERPEWMQQWPKTRHKYIRWKGGSV